MDTNKNHGKQETDDLCHKKRLKKKYLVERKTGVKDIIRTVKEYKWKWVGHIGWLDERWTRLTTEWQPLCGKRKQGRPRVRWRDEIAEALGTPGWMRQARDWNEWKRHEEATDDDDDDDDERWWWWSLSLIWDILSAGMSIDNTSKPAYVNRDFSSHIQ